MSKIKIKNNNKLTMADFHEEVQFKRIIAIASGDGDVLEDSSSASDDDELEELKALEFIISSRNCIQKYEEVIASYNHKEFVTHFRISREIMSELAREFEESDIYQNLLLQPNSRVNINADKSVLLFLWFAGHQSSFRDVGDRFNLSISSVFDVITRVMYFLSNKANHIISLPTEAAKRTTMDYYQNEKGFPNVIGAIDGCHIKIDKPSERHTDYCNRKDYYSIILQGVCNEDRNFIDIFIGYPGSVHDARVFRNSTLFPKLPMLCDGCYILGDSAYPLSPFVLTPYRDNGHLTAAQKYFNKKLSSCRVSIENAFGILKQRCRHLYHVKLRGAKRISHFIRACCVLNNIANKDDIEIFRLEEQQVDDQPQDEYDPAHDNPENRQRGIQLRDEICRQLLQRRRR